MFNNQQMCLKGRYFLPPGMWLCLLWTRTSAMAVMIVLLPFLLLTKSMILSVISLMGDLPLLGSSVDLKYQRNLDYSFFPDYKNHLILL